MSTWHRQEQTVLARCAVRNANQAGTISETSYPCSPKLEALTVQFWKQAVTEYGSFQSWTIWQGGTIHQHARAFTEACWEVSRLYLPVQVPILEVKAPSGWAVAFFNVLFPITYVFLEFEMLLWIRIVFLDITVGNGYYSLPWNINSFSPTGRTTDVRVTNQREQGPWTCQFLIIHLNFNHLPVIHYS